MQLLEDCGGIGPDYPQRDYLRCFYVFSHLNQYSDACKALKSAYSLLEEKAYRIADNETRQSFLNNISFHREILHETKRLGIATSQLHSYIQ